MRARALLALSVLALIAVVVTPQAAARDPAVAALQVGLRSHGLYRGTTDGVAGPSTLGALTAPAPTVPLPLAWPMTAPVLGDHFGPRGNGWHSGIDLRAPMGTPVYAARSGRVAWAGWRNGGWGFLVVV